MLRRRSLLLGAAAMTAAAPARAAAQDWVMAWDSQGDHRTATPGDEAGAAWLAAEARAMGAAVEIESFPIARYDPVAAFVELEGVRYGGVPMFDAPDTPDGRIHALAGRFARLVGVLLGGGAPLLTALDDTIESIGDPIARDDVTRVRTLVREGSSLRGALAESPIFPTMLSQLMGVGENAGQLRTFLMKAADIFEERTERATQRLATLAEPAMIVVFGAIVAFVALSLLQAIYGINASSFK